jgi:cell division protein FtsB
MYRKDVEKTYENILGEKEQSIAQLKAENKELEKQMNDYKAEIEKLKNGI